LATTPATATPPAADGDTLVMPRSASQLEKTVLLPRQGGADETKIEAVLSAGPIDPAWMAPELAGLQAEAALPVQPATLHNADDEPATALPFDATILLPVRAGSPPKAPAVSRIQPSQLPTSSAVLPQDAPSTGPTRRLGWALAGIVALAGVGLGLGLSGRLGAPAAAPANATMAAITAPSAADTTVSTPPVLTPSVALTAPQAAAASLSPSIAPVAAPAAAAVVVATAPTIPGIAPAATKAEATSTVAKKVASSKDKPAKTASSAVAHSAAPTATGNANASAAPDEAVAVAALRTGAASSPRQACEDRILIGFQICMTEQCAKPAFSHHPVCMERLAMEQRRRDTERSLR
jgi:eukaryotic-like serine/threonine-protein kinase